MDLIHFFNLSRPFNVLITLLAFGLSAFIALGKNWLFLEDPRFWYGCVCLTVISATGYWVNDAFDFKIDRVNRPGRTIVNAHLSVKKVLTAYFPAVALVLLFSFFTLDIALTALNAGAAFLLFAYAALLKRTTVIGNIVIASLTALVVYYAAVMYAPRMALIWTIVFAFEVTFIREVVKDVEDIRGDLQFKLQTLPIRIGISKTKQVILISYILFILSCFGPFVAEYLTLKAWNFTYLGASFALVQLPALLLARNLQKAETSEDFGRQSSYLKYLIFLGMVSVLFLN